MRYDITSGGSDKSFGVTKGRFYPTYDWFGGAVAKQADIDTDLHGDHMQAYATEKNLIYSAFFKRIRAHELTHRIAMNRDYKGADPQIADDPQAALLFTAKQEFFAEYGSLLAGDKTEDAVATFQAVDEWARSVIPELVIKKAYGLAPTTDSPYAYTAFAVTQAAEQTFGENRGVDFIMKYAQLPKESQTTDSYVDLIAQEAALQGVSERELETKLVDNYVALNDAYAEQLGAQAQV